MGRMGRFNFNDLRELQQKLNSLQNPEKFVEACTKELAARLLTKVVKRTPVGQYTDGKVGGTLRRGWTGNQRAAVTTFVNTLSIRKEGSNYIIDITNNTEYAIYVEYGHRTANHREWVPGQFMMTISEQELQQMAPAILERKIQKYLGGVMH